MVKVGFDFDFLIFKICHFHGPSCKPSLRCLVVSLEIKLRTNFRIEEALGQLSLFDVDFLGSNFEVVEGTLQNYPKLGAIKIRCNLDSKWLNTLPKDRWSFRFEIALLGRCMLL